jgi:hypothetical protein
VWIQPIIIMNLTEWRRIEKEDNANEPMLVPLSSNECVKVFLEAQIADFDVDGIRHHSRPIEFRFWRVETKDRKIYVYSYVDDDLVD